MSTDAMSKILSGLMWLIISAYVCGMLGWFLWFLVTGTANRGW